MTYESVKEYIFSRKNLGIKPGLSRIYKLLNLLDNPQNNLKFIHVAGTNGKGSVCYMLSSILEKSGYKTGLFTSPPIISFRERFKINSKMISKEDVVLLFEEIKPHLDFLDSQNECITEFELETAMAFLYFSKQSCDVVVLEVGLGGKFDATNIISSSLVSVITSISFDHMNFLGNTIGKIATEKSGIIKENGVTVLYPQEDSVSCEIIKRVAIDKNNLFINAGEFISKIKILKSSTFQNEFYFENEKYDLNLSGTFQIKNALVVLLTAKVLKKLGFNIPKKSVKEAFKDILIPARFEKLSFNPLIILDGAHNFDGIKKLKETLVGSFEPQKTVAVVGMLKDKEYEKSISELIPCFRKIIMTPVDNERSLKIEDIEILKKTVSEKIFPVKNSNQALEILKDEINLNWQKFSSSTSAIICGSLYLAAEIRPKILKELENFQK